MHKLEEIKKKIIEKMEQMYDSHPDLSGSVIENIDVMAHAVKNLCKICEEEDGEYSSRYYPMVFSERSYDGRSYDGRSYGGEAYRGRKRDSMGRYASEGYSREGTWDTVNKIEDLIREAPDEQTRQELQRIAGRMRNG